MQHARFAVIPYVALQDRLASSWAWILLGTHPLHRRLGLVQRPESRRREVIGFLTDALRLAGHLPDDIH